MERYNDKTVLFTAKEGIEPAALTQVDNISELPFVHGMAIMPDVHLGKGSCVGAVVATEGAIVPSIIGVDIGCGMIAVKTKYKSADLPDSLESTRLGIERRIPLGAGAYNSKLSSTAERRVSSLQALADKVSDEYNKLNERWSLQLGTLGSGNHFVEICLDETDQVWVVLHSGSRGIGNLIASKHIKIAQKMMEVMLIDLKDKDLAYLPQRAPEFGEYIRDLHWAQEFARHSRDEMMDRVMTELSYLFFKEDGHQGEIEIERINCHHNFTQPERHFGRDLWISRKGAIQMKNGQKGVIPGSMGTRSYIVSGLENVMSFASAPHGAGRRFSRNEARKRFTMEDFEREMKGIECRHSPELIDELPGAYKDIDVVMENSKELVKVEHVLRQVLNVKGD